MAVLVSQQCINLALGNFHFVQAIGQFAQR